MTFEKLASGFLLTGLFLVCIIGFMSGMGDNYGEVIESSYVDTSRIVDQINETSSNANAWGESFKSDNLFVSTGTIVLVSIWGVTKLIWDTLITFLVIYLDIFTTLFGIPPMVTGVITALMIIYLIFLAWRTIKQG